MKKGEVVDVLMKLFNTGEMRVYGLQRKTVLMPIFKSRAVKMLFCSIRNASTGISMLSFLKQKP